jgi:hypothetical protein
LGNIPLSLPLIGEKEDSRNKINYSEKKSKILKCSKEQLETLSTTLTKLEKERSRMWDKLKV